MRKENIEVKEPRKTHKRLFQKVNENKIRTSEIKKENMRKVSRAISLMAMEEKGEIANFAFFVKNFKK